MSAAKLFSSKLSHKTPMKAKICFKAQIKMYHMKLIQCISLSSNRLRFVLSLSEISFTLLY